ncbi:MAG: hypothetical protein ACI4LX_06250 [Treponema sp.]
MKTKRNGNTLRHFLGFVLLGIMVLCFSCDNLFSFKVSQNSSDSGSKESSAGAKYTVSGSIVLKGAVPAELIAGGTENSESASTAKSAAPSSSSLADITYKLTFTNSSDSAYVNTVELNAGETSFSVALSKGTYELSVTGTDSSDNEIVSGKSSSFTLSDTNSNVSDLTVTVSPISTGSATGTVYLTLNLTDCGIQAYRAVWTENGTQKVTTVSAGGDGADISTTTFCMIEDGGSYPADAPQAVGIYEVQFYFYSDYQTLDGSTEVFSCTEYISVFQNMKTETWVNDANTSYISSGAFVLTKDIIQNRHKFYVNQTDGSSLNDGSYFSPLDSVKTAVAKICANNDTDPYTIVLCSDDIDTSSESSTSYIEINPSSSLNLTIQSNGAEQRTINASRDETTTGRVIYIGSNVDLTLENLVVTGGYASGVEGGGIYNEGTLCIKNCSINNNTSTTYGGGIYNAGIFTMNSGTVSNNTATSYGGGICVSQSMTLTMTGGTVSNNEANYGGGIYNYKGTFEMTGGTVTKNTASNSGGGICNKSTLIIGSSGGLDGSCTISENSSSYGGGIYVSSSASFTMTNGTVSNNEATSYGGGIYNGGTFEMTGGTVTKNRADVDGGGICNNSTLIIGVANGDDSSCTISENSSSYGGGIYLPGGSSFTMNCGTLSGNTATGNGGGIWSSVSVTIEKGLISGNSATNWGGAIYSEDSCTTMDFGSAVYFTGNTAKRGSVMYKMGGVDTVALRCTLDDDGDDSFDATEKNTSSEGYVIEIPDGTARATLIFYSTFNMSADNSIYITTSQISTDSGDETANQIHIAESLSNFVSSKKIKIVPSEYPADLTGIQVFSADSALVATGEYAKFCIADDSSGNSYTISSEGKIVPAGATTAYTDWDTLVNAVADIPSGTTSVSEFEIGADMTMTSALLSDCPVRLYAKNSYTLTRASSFTDTVFAPYAALTVEGVDGAVITFDGASVSSSGSFISVDNTTAAVTFSNVNFENFSASTDGAVVSAKTGASGCNATFTNCEFNSNKTSGNSDGGAVCIAGNAAFTFNQCDFTSNSAGASGGVLAVEHANASAVINDCSFTSNDASNTNQGGGIYVYKGSCKINGVTMSGNTTDSGSTDNDIYYYTSTANPELILSGTCTIPVVCYNVPTTSSTPSIMKIENLDTASNVGIQMSLYTYTLTKEIIQSSDGSDISSLLSCFKPVDSYAIALNTDNTGMYLTAITGEKSAPDSVGDIVFSDGSACAYSSSLILTTEQKSAAVAVIFYVGTDSDSLGNKMLGVGLKNSYEDGDTFEWCLGGADGYNELSGLICTASTDYFATAVFTGDVDGSDNWDVVQANCGDTSDMTTNYPAWDYAVNYGTNNWSGTSYESGWYLPTIAEFAAVYKNLSAINDSLDAAGHNTIPDSISFWTSTQYSNSDTTDAPNCALCGWTDDYIGSTYKTDPKYVLAIRKF